MNFCAEGTITNPKCYEIQSVDFTSEEAIFDILLDLLKSELPKRMELTMDCQDNPMFIHEEDIDLLPSGSARKFSLMLNPFGDVPTYNDSLLHRTVRYTFELLLTVQNELARCVTWELLRFKNIVEGLVVGAEIYIDDYISAVITPEGFRYFIPEQDGNIYRREGTYRFSVTVSQYRTN